MIAYAAIVNLLLHLFLVLMVPRASTLVLTCGISISCLVNFDQQHLSFFGARASQTVPWAITMIQILPLVLWHRMPLELVLLPLMAGPGNIMSSFISWRTNGSELLCCITLAGACRVETARISACEKCVCVSDTISYTLTALACDSNVALISACV